MRSFSLEEYSDRELVHIVHDLSDPDGWVTAQEVAIRVGLTKKKTSNVTHRFAWMRRFGIMERTKDGPTRWRLSPAGREMVQAANLNGITGVLHRLADAELVWASHVLANRFLEAKKPHATMTRREWQREFRRRGGR